MFHQKQWTIEDERKSKTRHPKEQYDITAASSSVSCPSQTWQLNSPMTTTVLLSLLFISLSLSASVDAYTGVPLDFWSHHRSRQRKVCHKSRFFHVDHVVPPLPSVVSLSAAVAGSNSTDVAPYSRYAPDNIDLLSETLPVVYTNNPSIAEQWLSDYLPKEGGVLGFDVESVPNAPWVKNQAKFDGPATVQLATPDSCLVIQLAHLTGRSSQTCVPLLGTLLSDKTIVKAGVDIDGDMLELYERFGKRLLQANSRLDLGGIGGDSMSGNRVGLKRLTKSILGIDLLKSKRVCLSNWSRVPLTEDQLAYCARDAWAGAAIVSELQRYDPETFGAKALEERLSGERPMRDLCDRYDRRIKAKHQLKELVGDNIFCPRKEILQEMTLSQRIDEERLRNIIKDTAPDPVMVLNVEPIGFDIN